MTEKIKIGISACLLGHNVRYNGGHSKDRFLTDTLGLFVEYVPVCPEVECGMPTPRETIRLEGDPQNPKLMTSKTGIDKTEQMQDWIARKLPQLEKENLCGFIFKSKSPSSGLFRIRVYGHDGKVRKNGVGMFARAFTEHFPRIPAEEDGRLCDPKLRENFIENIFTLKRWRDLLDQKTSPQKATGQLIDFHTRNKLLLLSHSQDHYRKMGKLVAQAKQIPRQELYDRYEQLMMEALNLKTTIKKNINVMQHMMGYFKNQLTSDEKAELLDVIDQYRSEYIPLVVPLTLLNHYVLKYDQSYLKMQTYLNPHPVALKLRTF